jgi:hypothetical protein
MQLSAPKLTSKQYKKNTVSVFLIKVIVHNLKKIIDYKFIFKMNKYNVRNLNHNFNIYNEISLPIKLSFTETY